MRIQTLTPIWKRPEVLKVFLIKFMELRKHTKKKGIQLDLTPIFSAHHKGVYYPGEFFTSTHLFSRYAIDTNFIRVSCTDNHPLGAKKNHGLNRILDVEWDYLLELGSDNVMHPKIFDYYKPYIDKKELMFGFTEGYVCEPKTKRCIWTKNRWNDGMCQGAGRMIHRSVVEKTIYKMGSLWLDESESGLDTESRKRINNAYGRTTNDPLEKVVKAPHPMVLDIKTNTNLWPMVWFDKWMERHPENFEEVDYEKITKEFGVWESLK